MEHLTGTPLVAYITQFEESCLELSKIKLDEALPAEAVVEQVDAMLEEYYSTVGKYPSSYILSALANYCLIHTLKDNNVDKMTKTDTPILSESQLLRRARTQHALPIVEMDVLNSKYNRNMDSLKKVLTNNSDS